MDNKDNSEKIFDPTVKLRDEIIGDGGYIFATPGTYTPIDIRDNSSLLPMPGEDMYSHFIRTKGGTRLSWVAFTEAIWQQNLLYFSFPKKGKRKLRKYARIRKHMCPLHDDFTTVTLSKDDEEWYRHYQTCDKCNIDFMCKVSNFCPGCGRRIVNKEEKT